jgi:hypothetical protein
VTGVPDPAAIAAKLGLATRAALLRFEVSGARIVDLQTSSPLRTLHLVRSGGRDYWRLTAAGEAVLRVLAARRGGAGGA